MVLVDEGAEALVELLSGNGVDYIFLNPGTQHGAPPLLGKPV